MDPETEGQGGEGALLQVAEPGAGTSFTCSEVQAEGCRVRGPEACALHRAVAHLPLPYCAPPGASSPGLRHRRSPFAAAAARVARARGPPGASARGPAAGPCGRPPDGPGGTGHQPPGGLTPHRPCPAPSGARPAGTRHGHPCGESSWGRASPAPVYRPFSCPGRWAAGKFYPRAPGPDSSLPTQAQGPGSCWKDPHTAVSRSHSCPL